MKTRLISILMVMFTVFAGIASAAVDVSYNFRSGIIESDGSITDTGAFVGNVNALGHTCTSAQCETADLGISGWPAPQTSSASGSMQLTYPTVLQNPNGYGVYFYAPGYITWEEWSDWSGTGATGPFDVILTRRENCNAPIDTFSVLNDVQPNVPLVIDIDASLDATTYAAIHAAGPLDYVPPSLEEYYEVDTRVTLTIYDWNDDIVFQDSQDTSIPFSGSLRVEFTWTPTIAGHYRAVAETVVTDDKCMASAEQETSKNFHVISEDPRNMCYTLLNNLATDDQFPSEGETLGIYGVKTSNYADDNYVLTPIPTDLIFTIVRQSDGNIMATESTTLPANDDAVAPAPFDFEWQIPNIGEGWYDITVTGIGNSPLCDGLDNLDETVSVEVYVGEAITEAPTLTGIPDVAVDENTMPPDNWIDLWQYASDDETPVNQLNYLIASESNPGLISCTVDSNRYIDCGMPALNSYGFSDVTVEISDGFYTDRDTFRVYVVRVNDYPIITNIPNVQFEVGSFVELDLDDYVSDVNYDDSELDWTFTGDDNVQVTIDPVTHIVRFESPAWTGQEQITFTVENPDGLTASDISVVTVTGQGDGDETNINNMLLVRTSIQGDDHFQAGETVQLGVGIENIHSEDIGNIHATAIVHELDMRDNEGPFTLREGEMDSKRLYLEIPQDAAPGMYTIRLTISNDDLRRVIHRDFIVTE